MFVNRDGGCGVEDHEVKTYPESPMGKKMRHERVRADISMGRMAELLQISVVSVSELERGHAVAEDWEEIFQTITKFGEPGKFR